jgi:NADH dehydrogenase
MGATEKRRAIATLSFWAALSGMDGMAAEIVADGKEGKGRGMERHQVVIVGGGFGGLAAAKRLAREEVDVTIIDRRNHHLFQPLLYQVATAALSPSEIAWPVRHILRRHAGVRTLLGTVEGIDVTGQRVVLDDGDSVPYDSLIIATGARHAYFGHDAWEEFAPGLKTLEDATAIRRRLLLAYEAAEREPDPEKRRALLTFVIIGGGPTGVEMAGAIIELAHFALAGEFRSVKVTDTRVVLIEGGERVLSNFDPALSDYTLGALRKLGVEVELGQPVSAIDADGVVFGEKRLDAATMIWAAGVQASPAARWLGVDADKSGRVKVEPDLTVPGLPNVFVVGDTAAMARPDGRPVPGVGDAAKQSGRHAAETVLARLAGDPASRPFAYRHAGDLATIGRRAAVIDFGWVRLEGRIAWWVWGIAHIYFLVDTRNRIFVTLNWLWNYLGGKRGARLITDGAAPSKTPTREIASSAARD